MDMKVRIDQIEAYGKKPVFWTIRRFVRWKKWQAKQNVDHPLVKFAWHRWTHDYICPSSLNWDRDVLAFGEAMCVSVKVLIQDDNKDLAYWIMDGLVIAAGKWNMATGNNGLTEILSMALWIKEYFRDKDKQLSEKAQQMLLYGINAFSECFPDLSDWGTIDAYLRCWLFIEKFELVPLVRSLQCCVSINEKMKLIVSTLGKYELIGKSDKTNTLSEVEVELLDFSRKFLQEA